MDKNKKDEYVIICGITNEGAKFRPSDWAERLTGAISSYGPGRRIIHHPQVRITHLDGIKCIQINPSLETENPLIYGFLMSFAHDNNLKLMSVPAEPILEV